MVVGKLDEQALRERAESALGDRQIDVREQIERFDPMELLYELRVHQIELEMQNEELRAAHDELLDSRDRYRDLYDDAPVGYMTIDTRSLVRDTNRTAARMLECNRSQLRHTPLTRMLSRDDADRLHRHLARTARSGTAGSIDIRIALPPRVPRQLQLDTVPLAPDEHGTILHRTTMTDTTAQKRSEERLTRLTTELEDRVEQRTQALSEANQELQRHLYERQEMQARLHETHKMEALGRLAGGIAHDFNNLLLAIKLELGLLGSRLVGDPEAREHVVEVGVAADRAAALTAQLLAFAKRDATHPERVDVSEVLERMDRMLRRVIGEDTQLTTRPDPTTGCAFADASRLEQVILNLVINARNAISPGGTISLETARVQVDEPPLDFEDAAPGPFVVIWIRDNGCGMTPEVQARLFEPFFTTRRDDGGTGLGLATVYGIVKQSGGFIEVHSEPGEGTDFAVYLPAFDSDEAVPAPSSSTAAPALGGTERVLLVEDLDMVRTVTGRLLRQQGYEVIEAANGEEALKHFEEAGENIDALVTDIVMPGMNGRALASAIRQDHPDLPIIYISGYPGDHGPEPGAHYLEKPFPPHRLLATLRSVLER